MTHHGSIRRSGLQVAPKRAGEDGTATLDSGIHQRSIDRKRRWDGASAVEDRGQNSIGQCVDRAEVWTQQRVETLACNANEVI